MVKYVKHPHPEPLVAAMPERREPPARRSPAKGEYLNVGDFYLEPFNGFGYFRQILGRDTDVWHPPKRFPA